MFAVCFHCVSPHTSLNILIVRMIPRKYHSSFASISGKNESAPYLVKKTIRPDLFLFTICDWKRIKSFI